MVSEGSESLVDVLHSDREAISKFLHVGLASWEDLVSRVKHIDTKSVYYSRDEQLWTFLIACVYAKAGFDGIAKLAKLLTGSVQNVSDNQKIYFEALPGSPREDEGQTHLDLALGSIELREGTGSGIELSNDSYSWICFCEMKWYSDISYNVSHDQRRNQLARVIENAICFQNRGKYAERVHVTLVTPRVFLGSDPKSRLYQYKFEEYSKNPLSIKKDLDLCRLLKTDRKDWKYPDDVDKRISKLAFRHVSYEDLIENMPPSLSSEQFKQFFNTHGME